MIRVKERPNKLEFSEKIMYDGPHRHRPLHDDHYIKIMPAAVQGVLIEQNEWAEQKENKHSILLTPPTEPYK